VVTLAYLALQIRQNTRVVRTSNFQNVVDASSNFTSAITGNAEVADIYRRGLVSYAQLSETEQIRFHALVSGLFTAFQLTHQLYARRLIDEELYQGHQDASMLLLRAPGIREWWVANQFWYHEDFRGFVKKAIGRTAAQQGAAADEPQRVPIDRW
jgi:hypothetical protein